MSSLTRVRSIARKRRSLEEEYRAALQAARDAGYSGAAIAKAAGCSRQNVLALTTAPSPPAQSL